MSPNLLISTLSCRWSAASPTPPATAPEAEKSSVEATLAPKKRSGLVAPQPAKRGVFGKGRCVSSQQHKTDGHRLGYTRHTRHECNRYARPLGLTAGNVGILCRNSLFYCQATNAMLLQH